MSLSELFTLRFEILTTRFVPLFHLVITAPYASGVIFSAAYIR